MKLIVGLGNPGSRYQKTRHNVGFWVADQLAATNGASGWQSRFDGLVADPIVGGEKCLLLKPQTYMNCSGLAVRRAYDFHKLEPADLIVICDDFSLPVGKLRFRKKGSSGGQKGLEDVIRSFGTDEISRLRIGVGSPGRIDPAAFVLSEFRPDERPIIADAVIEAGRAIEFWRQRGIAAAMNEFNGKDIGKE